MAQVLINEKTLSDIGDAIRQANNEDKYKDVTLVYTGVLNEPSDWDGGTNFVNQRKAYVILPNTIINQENKDKIISVEVKMEISNFSDNYYISVVCGECMTDTTEITDQQENSYISSDLIQNRYITFMVKGYLSSSYSVTPNGRSVFISFGNNNSDIVINYTITIKTTIKGLDPDPETNYLPSEIPNKITDIASLSILPEYLVWSGNCQYKGSGDYGYGWFLSRFKDKIITKDITSAEYMFQGCKEESIPFEINLKNDSSIGFYSMYNNCRKLKQLPKINGSNINGNNFSNMFYSCLMIKTIPENYFDFINWDSPHTNSSANFSGMLSNCYSLREIPKQICENLWNTGTTSSYNNLFNAFSNCYSLNKILDWAVTRSNGISSNCGWNTFSNCSNLSRFTFEKNEDGTAKTANMKNTTLDFSQYVGYQQSEHYPETYFSTSSKRITDDTTYQALKNDIDSWTTDVNYSKYNHDSAVETINSLPDTSAYGTNTIKFKGNSGALTDGGAINTLTDAEIAIATVKGWTVTLV